MRVCSSWLMLAMTALSCCGISYADEQVGDFADPAALEFQGNTSFSDDELRKGLFVDPDVMLATHDFAPLESYVEILPQRIEAGYHYQGFLDAEAVALLNRDNAHIEVWINEGPRYQAGEVRIEGAHAINPEALARWITEPHAGNSARSLDPDGSEKITDWLTSSGSRSRPKSALWNPGQNVCSYAYQTARIEEVVRRAYAEVGRRQPVLAVRLERDFDKRVAWPMVKVINEGPPATVESIEVSGLVKNTREEMLAFLELEQGLVFDRAEQTRIERALWHSARFCKYSVRWEQDTSTTPTDHPDAASPATILKKVVSPPAKPAGNTLAIKVTEYAAAPKLTETLSPESLAMLNFRRWLISLSDRDEELVLRTHLAERFSAELILTADRGFIANVTIAEQVHEKALRYTAIVNDKTFAIYALSRGEKVVFVPDACEIQILHTQTLSNDDEKPFTLCFGAGSLTVRADLPPEHIRIINRMPPAVFAALSNTQHLKEPMPCALKDGVLTLDIYGVRLTIRAETGELISLETVDDELPPTVVTVERGVFAARLESLQTAAAESRNVFDAERPFASTARFILDDPAWRHATDDSGVELFIGIAKKFFDAEVLEAVFACVTTTLDTAFPFAVGSADPIAYATHDDPWIQWLNALRYQLPVFARTMFPHDSWASELMIEFGLASTGRGQHLGQAFEQGVSRRGWGPLACWCLAEGASMAGHKELVEPCALQALERLELDDFQRDCSALLARDAAAGQVVDRFVKFVRDLTFVEAIVVEGAAKKASPALSTGLRTLRADPGEPADIAMARALSAVWDAGWRYTFTRHFAGLTPAPPAPVALTPTKLPPDDAPVPKLTPGDDSAAKRPTTGRTR